MCSRGCLQGAAKGLLHANVDRRGTKTTMGHHNINLAAFGPALFAAACARAPQWNPTPGWRWGAPGGFAIWKKWCVTVSPPRPPWAKNQCTKCLGNVNLAALGPVLFAAACARAPQWNPTPGWRWGAPGGFAIWKKWCVTVSPPRPPWAKNAPNAREMSIWQLWGPFFLQPFAPEPPSGAQPCIGARVHLGALQLEKGGASRCPSPSFLRTFLRFLDLITELHTGSSAHHSIRLDFTFPQNHHGPHLGH